MITPKLMLEHVQKRLGLESRPFDGLPPGKQCSLLDNCSVMGALTARCSLTAH